VNGEEIALIGTIRSNAPFENIDSGRQRIEELDALVQQVLDEHLLGEIVPIVIGGGHNNAYPVICAISKHLNQPINVINLDPHADCRALEGRHSGNPFSYAKNENFLDHYTVLGLHKPYNSEFILSYLDENEFNYTFFEDYIEDPEKFKTDIRRFNAGIAAEKPFGVELDLDSMEGMPSSAFTPSGINTSQARFYISHLSKNPNAAYFHFPEGAPSTPHEEKIVGKTLAYLVWDIIS
jgi:formiminoglutamase